VHSALADVAERVVLERQGSGPARVPGGTGLRTADPEAFTRLGIPPSCWRRRRSAA
jgi:hypothetical protein